MSDSGGSGGADVGEESQRPKVAPAVEKKEQQAEKQVQVPHCVGLGHCIGSL